MNSHGDQACPDFPKLWPCSSLCSSCSPYLLQPLQREATKMLENLASASRVRLLYTSCLSTFTSHFLVSASSHAGKKWDWYHLGTLEVSGSIWGLQPYVSFSCLHSQISTVPGQNRHTITCEWISDYLLSLLSHVLLPISSSYFLLVLYFKKMYLQQWGNIILKFFLINLWKLMLGSTHSYFYCSAAVGDLPFFWQVLTEMSIFFFFVFLSMS